MPEVERQLYTADTQNSLFEKETLLNHFQKEAKLEGEPNGFSRTLSVYLNHLLENQDAGNVANNQKLILGILNIRYYFEHYSNVETIRNVQTDLFEILPQLTNESDSPVDPQESIFGNVTTEIYKWKSMFSRVVSEKPQYEWLPVMEHLIGTALAKVSIFQTAEMFQVIDDNPYIPLLQAQVPLPGEPEGFETALEVFVWQVTRDEGEEQQSKIDLALNLRSALTIRNPNVDPYREALFRLLPLMTVPDRDRTGQNNADMPDPKEFENTPFWPSIQPLPNLHNPLGWLPIFEAMLQETLEAARRT